MMNLHQATPAVAAAAGSRVTGPETFHDESACRTASSTRLHWMAGRGFTNSC